MRIHTWQLGLVLVAGCTETSSPPQPQVEAVRLAAASPTLQTAQAGSLVKDIPTVIAYDTNGSPVAGVVVTFAMESGAETGANIEHSVDTTNSDGVARVRFWRVGTKTSVKNVLSAKIVNAAPILFSASVLPGPVDHMIKLAGDNQVVQMGTALAIDPRILVVDAYDNPVADSPVLFAITQGGGSIPAISATTDSAGSVSIAWTAGNPGVQLLQASSGRSIVSFHALAVRTLDSCSHSTELLPLSSVSAVLPSAECARDGRSYTTFYFMTSYTAAWTLEMRSSDFDPYLELRDLDGKVIAADDNGGGNANSRMRVFVPIGTYQLVASSKAPNTGGSFRVSSQPSQVAGGCDGLFVPRGQMVEGVLHPLFCGGVAIGNANLLRFHLDAGDSVLVSVQDQSYSDPNLVMTDESGNVLQTENVVLQDFYRTLRYRATRLIDITVIVFSTEDWAEYSLVFN